tara:strand:- start:222 stop:362 length:141 start_codon:yes stop_codon:yes gene_type:complete
MKYQEIIILLLFAIAAGFIGYRFYKNFSKSNSGCSKGCGCGPKLEK